MRVSVTWQIDTKWIQDLNDSRAIRREIRWGLIRAASAVQKRARELAPVDPRAKYSGLLRRTIGRNVRGFRAVVRAKAWYGHIQEFGTQVLPGGAIKPKRKKYLTFKVGNRWVKLKEVRLRGSGFMQRAAEGSTQDIQAAADGAATRIARLVEGR